MPFLMSLPLPQEGKTGQRQGSQQQSPAACPPSLRSLTGAASGRPGLSTEGRAAALPGGSADAAGVVQDLPRVFHCLGTQDQAGPVEGLEISCPGDKRSKTFYFW